MVRRNVRLRQWWDGRTLGYPRNRAIRTRRDSDAAGFRRVYLVREVQRQEQLALPRERVNALWCRQYLDYSRRQ